MKGICVFFVAFVLNVSAFAEIQHLPAPMLTPKQIAELSEYKRTIQRFAENGKKIERELRLVFAGPAPSYGSFDGRLPECYAEEPSLWEEISVRLALEVIVPGSIIFRVPKREPNFFGEIARAAGIEGLTEVITRHLPAETVASCHDVLLIPRDGRLYRFRSVRLFVKDADGDSWYQCSATTGLCDLAEVAWVRIPKENTAVFASERFSELVDRPEYWMLTPSFGAFASPSFLNWSKHRSRLGLLILEFERV